MALNTTNKRLIMLALALVLAGQSLSYAATTTYGDKFAGTEYYVWPRWNLRTTGWKWTASGSGTAEYYLEVTAGGTPVHPDTSVALTDPPMVEGNSIDFTEGTMGALATSQFDWGDNDTLGYSTLYVRLADGADPDAKADGWVLAGGDNAASGISNSGAWETSKYAIETGITRDGSNGDRVNLKSGADDNYATAGENVDVSLYATDATEAAPLIIQGYDTTENDRGLGSILLASTAKYMDDTTFDFFAMQDIKMVGNIDSGGLTQTDRSSARYNCYFVNNGTSSAYASQTDGASSMAVNCYFEGEATTQILFSGSWNLFGCMVVNRGNGGLMNPTATGSVVDCLGVIEGNPGSGDVGFSGNCTTCAVVCLGTPGASSSGILGSEKKSINGCYVENLGEGYVVLANTVLSSISNNSYYNCTTPLKFDSATTSKPLYAETPTDAGQSIFVDSTQSTAAACDFTIRAGTTPVSNILSTPGFVDSNYSIDKRFNVRTDTGLGLEDTAASGFENSARYIAPK